MSKYKVGDYVKVKSELPNWSCIEKQDFINQVYRVVDVAENNRYFLETGFNYNFSWSDEELELFNHGLPTYLELLVRDYFHLEFYEPFYIDNAGPYFFCPEGLAYTSTEYLCPNILIGLLTNTLQIRVKRYLPKTKERYYYIDPTGETKNATWEGLDEDYYRFNAKNCFLSEVSISDEMRAEIVENMIGEYLDEQKL